MYNKHNKIKFCLNFLILNTIIKFSNSIPQNENTVDLSPSYLLPTDFYNTENKESSQINTPDNNSQLRKQSSISSLNNNANFNSIFKNRGSSNPRIISIDANLEEDDKKDKDKKNNTENGPRNFFNAKHTSPNNIHLYTDPSLEVDKRGNYDITMTFQVSIKDDCSFYYNVNTLTQFKQSYKSSLMGIFYKYEKEVGTGRKNASGKEINELLSIDIMPKDVIVTFIGCDKNSDILTERHLVVYIDVYFNNKFPKSVETKLNFNTAEDSRKAINNSKTEKQYTLNEAELGRICASIKTDIILFSPTEARVINKQDVSIHTKVLDSSLNKGVIVSTSVVVIIAVPLILLVFYIIYRLIKNQHLKKHVGNDNYDENSTDSLNKKNYKTNSRYCCSMCKCATLNSENISNENKFNLTNEQNQILVNNTPIISQISHNNPTVFNLQYSDKMQEKIKVKDKNHNSITSKHGSLLSSSPPNTSQLQDEFSPNSKRLPPFIPTSHPQNIQLNKNQHFASLQHQNTYPIVDTTQYQSHTQHHNPSLSQFQTKVNYNNNNSRSSSYNSYNQSDYSTLNFKLREPLMQSIVSNNSIDNNNIFYIENEPNYDYPTSNRLVQQNEFPTHNNQKEKLKKQSSLYDEMNMDDIVNKYNSTNASNTQSYLQPRQIYEHSRKVNVRTKSLDIANQNAIPNSQFIRKPNHTIKETTNHSNDGKNNTLGRRNFSTFLSSNSFRNTDSDTLKKKKSKIFKNSSFKNKEVRV